MYHAELAYKHGEFVSQLPRVRPFYAVKCNDDPLIVDTLHSLGCGFDCASKGEMSMALKAGVKPGDIIFAHPAKQVSHIQYAKEKGIKVRGSRPTVLHWWWWCRSRVEADW